jgi:hypothetical protein
MTSLPVMLIKDSTAPLQNDLSKSAQYVPVSRSSEPSELSKTSEPSELSKTSEPSEPSEPSTHPKALFPYPV